MLRTLAVDVTPVCNMFCSHCYAETFRDSQAVPLEKMEKALEEAYRLGVFHYVLQGGEPLVSPARLEAIIGYCRPDESYINVVSNGWAVTPDKVKWLVDLQVDKMTFSLDSGVEAEHDAIRGKGSYQRVLRAMDIVQNSGLLCGISTVVSRGSLSSEGFRIVYELAVAKGVRLHLQVAEPVGKWDGEKGNLITPEENRIIKDLERTCPRISTGQPMIHRDIFCGDQDHCPAGTEFMAISSDGNFLPCNFLQFTLGKVGDKSLADMRQDLLASPWFDGSHPNCICGEDDEFIDTFIVPHKGQTKPLNAYEVFGLEAKA